MSEITGKQFDEKFKMRVISGMLVNGSILVSWATGKKASSQIDWGFDKSVPNTTPEFNADRKDMKRYHQVFFPITYMDSWHYFRVRSRTASGKIGVSPVYKVFVAETLEKESDNLSVAEITMQQVMFPANLDKTVYGLDSSALLDAQPIAISEVTLVPITSKPLVKDTSTSNQLTTFETNINTTIS